MPIFWYGLVLVFLSILDIFLPGFFWAIRLLATALMISSSICLFRFGKTAAAAAAAAERLMVG